MLKKRISQISVALLQLLLITALVACSTPTQLDSAEDNHDHTDEDYQDHDEGLTAHLDDLTPITLAAGEKLRVVATTNILADLVSNIAGDAIELTPMVPIGADPHAFSPTPRDVAAVADAHLVFINGFNLEEFLGPLIENAGGEAVVVAVSEGIETREFNVMEGHDADHEEDETHKNEAHEEEDQNEGHKDDYDDRADHAHEGIDSHTWMTPANALIMVHNIEVALSALDPANRGAYAANAEVYEAELEALDAWVVEQIDTIPEANREMVTDHDAFGYYADRYGLRVIGAVIPAYSTAAEPSAQELATLLDAISEFEAKAVFVGTTVNPKLAEQVARDAGVQVVPLYTGSFGEPGSGVETYLDFIRTNTIAIVEALQ